MLNPNHIKTRLEDVKHWPNVTYSKLEILDETNSKIFIEVPKEEADLLMELKTLSKKLSNKKMDRILSLVDNYGNARYSEGYKDSTNDDYFTI